MSKPTGTKKKNCTLSKTYYLFHLIFSKENSKFLNQNKCVKVY